MVSLNKKIKQLIRKITLFSSKTDRIIKKLWFHMKKFHNLNLKYLKFYN